jgi:alanyl-tRNA synthetase
VTPKGSFVEYMGDFPSAAHMKAWAKDVRSALGSGVIAAGTSTPDAQLFVTVSDDLVAAGLDASDLVREAVAVSGGKGGGRPEMAQGRTGGPDGLARAMETLRERLQG